MESNTVTFKNTVAAKLKKTSSKCLKQKTKMNSLTYVIGKVRLTGFRYSGIQVAKLCLGCWWLPCRPFSLTGRLCLCGNYGQGWNHSQPSRKRFLMQELQQKSQFRFLLPGIEWPKEWPVLGHKPTFHFRLDSSPCKSRDQMKWQGSVIRGWIQWVESGTLTQIYSQVLAPGTSEREFICQ